MDWRSVVQGVQGSQCAVEPGRARRARRGRFLFVSFPPHVDLVSVPASSRLHHARRLVTVKASAQVRGGGDGTARAGDIATRLDRAGARFLPPPLSLPPPTSHSFVPRPVPCRLDLAPVPSRHERPPPRARRPRRLLLALTSSAAPALDRHAHDRRRAASTRSRHARLGRRERLKPRRRPGAAGGRRPGRLGSLGCVSLASGSSLQPLS